MPPMIIDRPRLLRSASFFWKATSCESASCMLNLPKAGGLSVQRGHSPSQSDRASAPLHPRWISVGPRGLTRNDTLLPRSGAEAAGAAKQGFGAGQAGFGELRSRGEPGQTELVEELIKQRDVDEQLRILPPAASIACHSAAPRHWPRVIGGKSIGRPIGKPISRPRGPAEIP
jgi:hypothetical protein